MTEWLNKQLNKPNITYYLQHHGANFWPVPNTQFNTAQALCQVYRVSSII